MMIKERLKELRRKKGIKTQAELAKMSGVSLDTIRNLESGRRNPSRDMLIRLAEFFDCEIEYLLGKEREGKVVFGELAEAVDLLEGLPEEKRKATIQLLRTLK